jgi:hypothetical protein
MRKSLIASLTLCAAMGAGHAHAFAKHRRQARLAPARISLRPPPNCNGMTMITCNVPSVDLRSVLAERRTEGEEAFQSCRYDRRLCRHGVWRITQ